MEDAKNELPVSSHTLLDQVLPEAEFVGRVSIPVRAEADRLFEALRAVSLNEMPLAFALGELRYLPARFGRRGNAKAKSVEPFIQQFLENGSVVLAEAPQREIVLGSAGKYHQIADQDPRPFRVAHEFHAFDAAGYQKLVIAIRVEEDGGRRRLVLEHRTHPLSPDSRRAFARYWVVIKPMGNFVSWLLLRAVRRRAESAAKTQGMTPVRS